MRLLAVVLALIAIISGIALSVSEKDARIAVDTELAQTADALQVYRNAVVEYADANPTAEGPVANEDLNLPDWFLPSPDLGNYVDEGEAFVFVVTSTTGAANKLLEDSPQSALVGTAKAGVLVSPVDGVTAIALPSAIPDGAVVYASPKAAAVAACGPEPVVTESQAGTCPVGQYGGFTQTRNAVHAGAASPTCWTQTGWSAWSPATPPVGACTPCPAPEATTQTVACPVGQFGVHNQQRTRTFDCGAGTWNAWSSWSTTSNTCAPCPGPETATQTVACPVGQSGTHSQQRTRTFDCGAGTWNAWGAWTTTSNTCAACPTPESQTQTVACPVGQFGVHNQQRTRTFDCGAGTWNAWSSWSTTSNTCAPCPGPESQTQTVACPVGQTGSLNQQRTRSFNCAAGTWNAWSSWSTTSGSCTPCPGPESQTQSVSCAAGQYGGLNQQRTRSFDCAAGTWNAWSGWSTTSGSCSACPAASSETGQRWDPRNIGCSAGTYGTYTWDMRQSRTRSVSYSCPAGTASLPSPTYGAWSGWFDDNVTQNTVFTCVGCPGPQERWIPYTANSCPAGFYGITNWQYREVRSASCPAGSTAPTWSAWAWDGVGGSYVSGTCTACPASTTQSQTQWVASSAACPVGQTGSNTWEREQVSTRTVSYNCPAGTGTLPSPTTGPWGAWSDTGATRNVVNTCTPTGPTWQFACRGGIFGAGPGQIACSHMVALPPPGAAGSPGLWTLAVPANTCNAANVGRAMLSNVNSMPGGFCGAGPCGYSYGDVLVCN